jgi:hypothetical protein
MKTLSTAVVKQVRNFATQKLTIGLDLGDRSSWYCVLDEAGQGRLEQKPSTTPKAMQEVLGGDPAQPDRVRKRGAFALSNARTRFDLKETNHSALNRWQHRLNREHPMCTERNESLLESANGSMATVANSAEEKLSMKNAERT